MSKIDENPYRPCPCGSGEKYKFCCLDKDREKRRTATPAIPFPGYDQPPDDVVEEAREAPERGTELVGRLRGREAIPYIERAIRLFPEVPNPHNNLAMAHFIEGDIEKALEIVERVDREIDPGNVFALGQGVHYLILLGGATSPVLRSASPDARRRAGFPALLHYHLPAGSPPPPTRRPRTLRASFRT
jgi:hypothetical protein